MRSRKAPRIRLDSAKAVPQVFFQASGAAIILFILTVSTNIVENSIPGNRVGDHMQVSHSHELIHIILQIRCVFCGTDAIYTPIVP